MARPIIGRIERRRQMKFNSEQLSVYFIAGTQDIKQGTLPDKLEQALKAGITCFQYREKGFGSLKGQRMKEMARTCQALCRQYQIPFIINDEVTLALELDADGIHVGQEDQGIQEVLTLFPDKIVGLSCYDQLEVTKANALTGISYYGIGPVYGTQSKSDAKEPIGPDKLQELAKLAAKPVVAIGGISVNNRQALRESGIDGVSVISALTQAKELAAVVQKLS
ncbi:thiamine phosphate synthase [Erwinia sp. CPCC 100877]|nr:thiamine phosphate synthase [Erwinia sp. CPCC 100877]